MFASKTRCLLSVITLFLVTGCQPLLAQSLLAQSKDADKRVAEIFKQPAETEDEFYDQLTQLSIMSGRFRFRKPAAELDPLVENAFCLLYTSPSPRD